MTTPDDQAVSGWPPAYIDRIDRNNNTKAKVQHPKDHEDLEVAVNAIIDMLGTDPSGPSATVTIELLRHLGLIGDVAAQTAAVNTALLDIVEDITDLQTGGSAALAHVVHYQTFNAETWVVDHGFNYDPVLAVIADGLGLVVGFEAVYEPGRTTLSFTVPITGRVLLAN